MSRVILRFQSLSLREDGGARSVIHFEVEDDEGIARSRAVIRENDDGSIDVGAPCRAAHAIDADAFTTIVHAIYDEQMRLVAKLCGAGSCAGCIVALGDRTYEVMERQAIGW